MANTGQWWVKMWRRVFDSADYCALTGGQKVVMLALPALAEQHGPDRGCIKLSAAEIAKELRIGRQAVRGALASLAKTGFIERVGDPRAGAISVWRIARFDRFQRRQPGPEEPGRGSQPGSSGPTTWFLRTDPCAGGTKWLVPPDQPLGSSGPGCPEKPPDFKGSTKPQIYRSTDLPDKQIARARANPSFGKEGTGHPTPSTDPRFQSAANARSAWEHYRAVAAPDAPGRLRHDSPDAPRLRKLIDRIGLDTFTAAVDHLVGDPFWSDKITLSAFFKSDERVIGWANQHHKRSKSGYDPALGDLILKGGHPEQREKNKKQQH